MSIIQTCTNLQCHFVPSHTRKVHHTPTSFLQILQQLAMPLKGQSLSQRICPPTDCGSKIASKQACKHEARVPRGKISSNDLGLCCSKQCGRLYSHLQRFKTRHNFQAFQFLCYDVRLFNFMFLLHHPIWIEEEYKERKRTFQTACEKTTTIQKQTNKKSQTTTTTNTNKQINKQKQTCRLPHFSNCVVLCFW